MLKEKYKIFNLSFPKTGTISFVSCMRSIGLKTKHWDPKMAECFLNKNYNNIIQEIKKNQVFTDFPWCLMYNHLNSKNIDKYKFILFERDENDWINSCLKFFNNNRKEKKIDREFREKIFGSAFPKGNECNYLQKYKSHNLEIKIFFENKKNFISIKLGNDEDWKRVCDFLNIQYAKFPHLNKSTN